MIAYKSNMDLVDELLELQSKETDPRTRDRRAAEIDRLQREIDKAIDALFLARHDV